VSELRISMDCNTFTPDNDLLVFSFVSIPWTFFSLDCDVERILLFIIILGNGTIIS